MKKKKLKNKFEKKIDGQLRRSKRIYEYEGTKLPYIIESNYVPDFSVTTPTGGFLIECKGYFRPEDKRKLRAVKRKYPLLDLRIVFYREVKEYVKWAEKHGFPYAIGRIPRDWLNS